MKFFKDNSYDIVKLFINQVGITIFSLMLYFSAALIENEKTQASISLAIAIFSTLFYLALIYNATWDMGAKDRVRIDSGRMEYNRYKGLALGAFANLPNYFLTVLSILGKGIYMIGGSLFFDGIFAFSNLILRILGSMYIGILSPIFSTELLGNDLAFLLQSVGFLLLPLLMIGVTQLGYTLGHKGVRIFSPTGQKKP